MKRGRKWLRMLMPLMAVVFLGFALRSTAQDDYQYDENNSSYDNSDEALIQPEGDVTYNTFHDELSPYGRWMDYPGYGNVWVCNVAGFRPYSTGGHWAYTRFGWTWVSDYNWGWAPFHYGRWTFDNAYGWLWVPGYTWGPAWVSWRTGGDYYGWAPLSPGISIGINVGIGIPAANWVFLPHRYMGYRSLNPYFINRQQNVTIIRNTTIINNTNVYNNNRFVVGPNRREVERYSGQRIQQQNIYVSNRRDVNRQDRNGIVMYNPNANRGARNQSLNNDSRQQPFDRRSTQNGVQQPGNGNDQNNNRLNKPERRDQNFENNNQFQNDQQRQQRMQDMQNRMQQQNNEHRQQQTNVMRQQQMNQRQQQMNDRSQQMQQMQERRQQDMQREPQDNQRQQMQQQRQQQMQQMQQRQQQFQQQRNQNASRPAAPQQSGGAGRRRN